MFWYQFEIWHGDLKNNTNKKLQKEPIASDIHKESQVKQSIALMHRWSSQDELAANTSLSNCPINNFYISIRLLSTSKLDICLR